MKVETKITLKIGRQDIPITIYSRETKSKLIDRLYDNYDIQKHLKTFLQFKIIEGLIKITNQGNQQINKQIYSYINNTDERQNNARESKHKPNPIINTQNIDLKTNRSKSNNKWMDQKQKQYESNRTKSLYYKTNPTMNLYKIKQSQPSNDLLQSCQTVFNKSKDKQIRKIAENILTQKQFNRENRSRSQSIRQSRAKQQMIQSSPYKQLFSTRKKKQLVSQLTFAKDWSQYLKQDTKYIDNKKQNIPKKNDQNDNLYMKTTILRRAKRFDYASLLE